MLCDMHSKLISYSSLYNDDDDEENKDKEEVNAAEVHEGGGGGRFAAMSVDLLPCTLARDLSRLVGRRCLSKSIYQLTKKNHDQ